MDIHPPHPAPITLKEALTQLSIVTVGILIALSFEGMLTWWHHRELLRETRVKLQAEIRGDQESIQTVLKGMANAKTRFDRALKSAGHLSSPDQAAQTAALFGMGKENLLYGVTYAWLNTATFTTAQSSGALALMSYDEAIRYADAYDLQAVYVRMQDSAERDAFSAALLGGALLESPSPAEVEEARRQLRVAIAGLAIMENIATKLNELYSRALAGSS